MVIPFFYWSISLLYHCHSIYNLFEILPLTHIWWASSLTLSQIGQAHALPISHKKAFYMSCSQNTSNQRPTMSHALVCICMLWPCDCRGMSAWARGEWTPRAWPRRPTQWNGNGRRQTAKQTLGEQLWVTYILGRKHVDVLRGAHSTARRLLEPEIWPGASVISQSQWLLMDMKLRTQHYYCDMSDPILCLKWSRGSKTETKAKKQQKKNSWDFNQLEAWMKWAIRERKSSFIWADLQRSIHQRQVLPPPSMNT